MRPVSAHAIVARIQNPSKGRILRLLESSAVWLNLDEGRVLGRCFVP